MYLTKPHVWSKSSSETTINYINARNAVFTTIVVNGRRNAKRGAGSIRAVTLTSRLAPRKIKNRNRNEQAPKKGLFVRAVQNRRNQKPKVERNANHALAVYRSNGERGESVQYAPFQSCPSGQKRYEMGADVVVVVGGV